MIDDSHHDRLFDLLQRNHADCIKIWANNLFELELTHEELMLIKLTIPEEVYHVFREGLLYKI